MTNENIQPIFNAVYDTYDNLKTMRIPSERLPAYTNLVPGLSVLDVGCGTGWSTIVAARLLENQGKIIGVDISDKQLEVARNKTITAGISNVEYHVMDAENLNFPDNSFDVVLSSLLIDLVNDTYKVLNEWYRVLKLGGQIVFSSAGKSFFQPMLMMFIEKIVQYRGTRNTERKNADSANTPDKCYELLKKSGFENISVNEEQMGFYMSDTDEYWQELTSSIMKLSLGSFDTDSQMKLKKEHLHDVDTLRTDKGIWIDVPVIFSVARKPEK